MGVIDGKVHGKRAREMAMTATILNVDGPKAHAFWPDGITSSLRWCVPIPSNWRKGTDILLHMMCVQFNTPGSPTVVLRSSIQARPAGEEATWNIENGAVCDQALPQGLHTRVTRTISGADVEHGEIIDWVLVRRGGEVADTVNDEVFCKMSA